jgi:hypothetical protein
MKLDSKVMIVLGDQSEVHTCVYQYGGNLCENLKMAERRVLMK